MTELDTNLRRRWGIAMLGVPDFTIDHNTFIINANNPNAYGAWSHNLTNLDSASYPPKTHVGVAHGSIGFANWRGNAAAPAHAGDWNLTSGTYSKASTTGGPLGATI